MGLRCGGGGLVTFWMFIFERMLAFFIFFVQQPLFIAFLMIFGCLSLVFSSMGGFSAGVWGTVLFLVGVMLFFNSTSSWIYVISLAMEVVLMRELARRRRGGVDLFSRFEETFQCCLIKIS